MVTARINKLGGVGKVTITSPVRTVVADPKFKPKPNIALNELNDVSTEIKQDGDVLLYSSNTDSYYLGPIDQASINIGTINGGSF